MPGYHPEWENEFELPTSLALQFKARTAVEFLIDRGGFYPGTRNDFAMEMGWTKRDGAPNRKMVEDVFTLTREQDRNPGLAELLGGFVVSYAPSRGGVALWDPLSQDAPLDHYVHLFVGDLQRQKQHETENRRRVPAWRTAGDICTRAEDKQLARLCYQAEGEINSTGFVSDHTMGELMKTFASQSPRLWPATAEAVRKLRVLLPETETA